MAGVRNGGLSENISTYSYPIPAGGDRMLRLWHNLKPQVPPRWQMKCTNDFVHLCGLCNAFCYVGYGKLHWHVH
jgi:hypothetical protein